MKLIILAALFAGLASAESESNCEGIILHGIKQEKVVLKAGLDKPYQLAMNYDTRTLYFSYSAYDGSYRVFESGYIHLKTNEFGTLKGVQGAFANAYDPKTNKVYIGGSDGIYVLNDDGETTTHLSDITHENIWQLFAKDKIYFTTYPKEEAFVYDAKEQDTMRVPEIGKSMAMLIALDNRHNIYYYNSTGLFVYKQAEKVTTSLGVHVVNAFSVDVDGNLYFSTPTAIFRIDDHYNVNRLASITNIYGMAIDSDGSIIYAADDSIVKLKSTGIECIPELNTV